MFNLQVANLWERWFLGDFIYVFFRKHVTSTFFTNCFFSYKRWKILVLLGHIVMGLTHIAPTPSQWFSGPSNHGVGSSLFWAVPALWICDSAEHCYTSQVRKCRKGIVSQDWYLLKAFQKFAMFCSALKVFKQKAFRNPKVTLLTLKQLQTRGRGLRACREEWFWKTFPIDKLT